MSDFIEQSTFGRPAPAPRNGALAGAALLGLIADQIVHTPGRPGLNILLWALAGTTLLWLLSRNRPTPVATETRRLLGGAVAFAALLPLRDAGALALFCLLSAIALLALAAGRAALAWVKAAYLLDIAAGAVRVGVLAAIGIFGWSIGAAAENNPAASAAQSAWRRRTRMIARGTVMALPPLLVLTALLTSADPMFERVLHTALFAGIEPLLQHIVFAAVIAWITVGYLRAFLITDADVVLARARIARPALSPSEIAVALSLLNILFIVFMVVQVKYLFGGAGLVEVTKGLSYAAYARRGFFELVAAAALVVPVLLLADWAASEEATGSRRVLRATSTLLVLLLAGVLASAAYRMWLYQDAYGLTEDRLYGSMFIVWLTAVLVWLAATVLRGRRRGFAFGALIAGFACVAALNVLNPHAMIARVNISRAAAGAKVDGRYLRTLSADAVPTLIAQLPALPPDERCSVATMLQKRWSGERAGGWRTWNLGDGRARKLVSKLRTPTGCS